MFLCKKHRSYTPRPVSFMRNTVATAYTTVPTVVTKSIGHVRRNQRSRCRNPSGHVHRNVGHDPGITGHVGPEYSAKLLAFIRKGDTLHVYAVDRLGRDALDVQSTVRLLLGKGVAVHVKGLGLMAKGVGELILAVLAQVADMERQRIAERTAAGRQVARESLTRTGLTHRGKQSLGRPVKADAAAVARWRREGGESLARTAAHWGLSLATVKRYCNPPQSAD